MVEKLNGKECAYETIYGAWWFVGLWIALSLISLVCLIGRKVYRKWAVALLHLSFLVILIGAFITHLTSEEGTIHLRKGVKTSTFTNTRHESLPLPFQLSLEEFRILYYHGTDAVMDYQATIMVEGNGNRHSIQVSMNHIGKVSGYRLYQSSYDTDLQGTILLMTHDPYGIPVTYAGYLLLLISLLWIMASRHTRIRHLYQLATKPVAVLLLVLGCSAQMMAQESPRTISKELAHEMAGIPVLYNERICPLNTAATDFVTKLCGKSTWKGMSADEIFIGWMIYYTEWESQPIIKVKSQYVQQILGIDSEWASVRDFYNSQHEYKLREAVHNTAISESARKALREVDEKIQTVTMFYHSEMLRMFPLRSEGQLKWYTPGSTELPQGVP
ncbi:MAG: cytochrome c biogenesis protein ResB, partial [Paraprevotella sp.]|nr:cytochrome c biogenesis protein ResB [Paraprevotella sp.]